MVELYQVERCGGFDTALKMTLYDELRVSRKINASILILSGWRDAASAQKIEAFIFGSV
ncbi:MAG: hypothetical protein AAFW82_10795 [Pseudomonadota bacterium]